MAPTEAVCPICGGTALVRILDQRDVPVHQNLVFQDRGDALDIARGDLDIRACTRCGFVFNRAFDAARLAYGPQYENTQLASPSFQDYMRGLVERVVDQHQARGRRIVEVGCGKGAFLRALVIAEGGDATGVGFDPSYVGPDCELDGRLRFERRLYDATCTDVPVDVLVCRHVIEHVADPLAMLRDFATALRHQSDARVFLETPCVAWVLRNRVVWDLFYEHCSLFTGRSLTTACARAGFSVASVTHTFGGQYLWLEATNTPPEDVPLEPGSVPELARAYAGAFQAQLDTWRQTLDRLEQRGRLAVWGAGAKGVTFANLLDPGCERFACLVDMNPAKQGGFVGGTGHPIVRSAQLAECGVATVLVLNSNYVEEIRHELEQVRLDIDVVDLGGA